MSGSRDYRDDRTRAVRRGRRWIRLTTACNSNCLFCLDADTPRGRFTPLDEVRRELEQGRTEGADKVVLSGGEGSLHPDFLEIVRAARDLGYRRVQTVTNGWRMADRGFYDRCVEAGLDELTFSLHGHDAELHERLTRTRGSFRRIVKAIARAARDPRMVCNIDVVLCRPNVGVLDRILELGISLGVTEFDLLHVIPQGRAWEHRDELLYDPAEKLEALHRVLRLARHPGYVVWTNRLPARYLEGLEELIQDPHKLLDEVRGRRRQLRRYLDRGTPLDCRDPARCVHCFLEPLCTSVDRLVARLSAGGFEVFDADLDRPSAELPFGCSRWGVSVDRMDRLPAHRPLLARVERAEPPPEDADLVLVAWRADQLDAWVGRARLDVELNRETSAWLLENRPRAEGDLARIRLVQPGRDRLEEALPHDVRDPADFFSRLDLPVRVAGLPACLTSGAVLADRRRVLERDLFDPDDRRLRLEPLVSRFVREDYRVHSLRCGTCRVRDRCEGLPIHMARDQGLALARPLVDGAWADEAARQLEALRPHPDATLADGRPAEPPHPDLPGAAEDR